MPIPEQDALRAIAVAKANPNDPAVIAKAQALTRAYQAQQEAAGLSLFPEQERRRDEQASTLRSFFTEPNHGLDEDTLVSLNENFRESPDEKFKLFNRKWFEAAGVPRERVEREADELMKIYSEREWGTPSTTHKHFFDRIARDYQTREEVANAAKETSLQNLGVLRSELAFKERFRENSAYVGREQKWDKEFQSLKERFDQKLAPHRSTIKLLSAALMTKEGVDVEDPKTMDEAFAQRREIDNAASYRELAEMVMMVPAEDRKLVIAAAVAASANDEAGRKSVMEGLVEMFDRGVKDFTEGIPSQGERLWAIGLKNQIKAGFPVSAEDAATPEAFLAAASSSMKAGISAGLTPMGDIAPAPAIEEPGDVSEEVKSGALALADRLIEAIDLRGELRNAAENEIDPITSDFVAMRGFYATARSIPYMAASFLPGGLLLNAGALQEQSYQQLRAANPTMTAEQAQLIASIGGPFQAYVERLQGKLALGQFKAVNRFFNQITRTKGAVASRFLTRTAATAGAEMFQENVQDLTPFAIQGLLSALDEDMPEVPWEPVFGDLLKQQPDLFFAVLPFAVIGGGAGTYSDFKGGAELLTSYDLLRATGLSEAAASEVRALASQGNVEGAQTLLRQEFKTLGQDQKSVQEARAEAIPRMIAEREAMQQALNEAGELDILPAILREGEKYTLRYTGGEAVQYDSHAEAFARFEAVASSAVAALHEDMITAARMTTSQIERGREVKFIVSPLRPTTEDMEAQGVATGEDMAQRMEISEADKALTPKTEERKAKAMAGMVANSPEARTAVNYILGSATTADAAPDSFGDRVVRNTVRLYQGATPFTLFEETAEGDAKFMIRELGLRRWMIGALRQWEATSGDTLFRASIKEESEIKDQDIVEAYSKMVQGYLAGRSKSGDQGRVFSRRFRKSIADALRGDFGAVLTGYASLFEAVYRRAAMIEKARRDGTFDGDLETFLAKSTGMSEQRLFERNVQREGSAIAQDLSGNPDFSSGDGTGATFSVIERGQGFKQTAMPDGMVLEGPATFSVLAHHGTPHKVDRFSLDKIGTGEGAQAYGWGLYFAEAMEVAKGYRDNLSKGMVSVQALREYYKPGKIIKSYGGFDRVISFDEGNRSSSWSVEVEEVRKNESGEWESVDRPRRHFTTPNEQQFKDAGIELPTGNLYTVELLPDEDDFLDWDKPLSEQSEKVRVVVSQILQEKYSGTKFEKLLPSMVDTNTGESLYRQLANEASPQETSEFLLSLGIPGIRYLDGNSRAEATGSYNYVIFDESLVRILEENGQPVEQQGGETTFSVIADVPPDVVVPVGKQALSYELLKSPWMSQPATPVIDPTIPNWDALHYKVTKPAQELLEKAVAEGHVDRAAKRLVEEVGVMMGYADVASGAGWYGRMRVKLKKALGADHEIFTHLLGTTSAQTAVELNFQYAFEALHLFKKGKYDKQIQKYFEFLNFENHAAARAEMEKRKIVSKDETFTNAGLAQRWIEFYDLLPRRSDGGLYGSNSYPTLKALAGVWLKEKMTPKTPQFAMNLYGSSLEATIDVWAARTLRRILWGDLTQRWRILPSHEMGVSEEDFALGQMVFRRAAKTLGMEPDDLQAIVWFGEKHIWEDNGWTGEIGALKSSFDEVAEVFFPDGAPARKLKEGNNIVRFIQKQRLFLGDLMSEGEFQALDPSSDDYNKEKKKRQKHEKEYLAALKLPGVSAYLKSGGRDRVREFREGGAAGQGSASVQRDGRVVRAGDEGTGGQGAVADSQGGVGTTFSLLPDASNLDTEFARMFSPFQRSPELRAKLGMEMRRRVAEQVTKLRPILRANRTKASIEAERKRRQDEIFTEKLDTLSAGEIQALANENLLEDNSLTPILAELLREKTYLTKSEKRVRYWTGSLMSKSEANRRGYDTTGGEWDAVPEGLPPYVYGGSITPDEAATMFDFETPEAFFDALAGEIQSRGDRKQEIEDAKRRVRELEKEARQEARAWADEAMKERKTVGGDRAVLLGFLRTLDAITRALPAEVRGKIGGSVALAKLVTPAAMLDEIESRVERIDVELERYLKKEADDRRKALFETAKPKREAGKKPKGKAGADIHDLFDRLKEALLWDGDQAEAWATMLEDRIGKGELSAEAEAHAKIEANLVRLFSDWKNADAARRTAAVDAGEEVWRVGYLAEKERIAEERERRAEIRAEIIAGTGKLGSRSERVVKAQQDAGLSGQWKEWFLSLFNFEQVAGFAMGAESKWTLWFSDAQREAEAKKLDEVQAVLDGLDELFRELGGSRLGGEKLQWKLSQPSFETKAGGKMSELQGITALLMWRQEDGKRHMQGKRDENGKIVSAWSYDETFIAEIEKNLSTEALAVMDYLTDQYAGEYETLNPIFRELNGINLPRNDKYSPLTVKPQQAPGGQTTDPVTGSTMSNGSMTPGSLRTRAQVVAEPDFRNAVEVFVGHKKQLAHWKAYAVFSRDAQAILGNREVGNAIEAASGQEAAKVLRSWLDLFAQGGVRDAGSHLALTKALGAAMGRASAVQLVGRLGTLAIQTTQLGAAAAKMPVRDYIVRLSKLLTGNLGWGEALNSPYIQRRLALMPASVQVAMEGLRAGKPNMIKHAAQRVGRLLSGTDALFTAGTYAMVFDYQLTKATRAGVDPVTAAEIARNEAERIVDEVAQPTRQGTRSLFEATATNPLGRVAWAFASEARKNMALVAYTGGRRPSGDLARALLYVIVFNGVLSALIRTAWRDLRDDEEDEDEWGMRRILLSVASEPLYGFPGFGEIAQDAIFAAAGEWKPSGSILDAPVKAPAAIVRAPENFGMVLEGDFEQPLRDLETMLMAGGLFNDTIAGLASFSHVLRDAESLIRNFIPDTP